MIASASVATTTTAHIPMPKIGRGVERRSLPHNLDAEASVLGGILIQNEVFDLVGSIEVSDFYDFRHQVVFGAMRTLQSHGSPIDIVTLEVEIEKAGKIDAIGGIAFLGDLALRVPTSSNVVAYAKIVRDKSVLRQLAVELSRNLERVYNYDDRDEVDELIGDASAGIDRVSKNLRDCGEKVPTITVHHALIELQKLSQTPVYKTPFDGLNEALGFGGMLSGQVYYLAGGTGFGKTSWIGSVVKHHALGGGQCLVAFYEMFAGYYVARMAAKGVGCHSNEILRCEANMGLVAAEIPRGIEFLDSPSLDTLRRAIDRVIRSGHAPPLVVVDYIQLLADRVSIDMAHPDPRQANTLASAGLRDIAKATGAVILAVSAASRSTSKALMSDVRKFPPRSLMDAAKESGSIEFDGAGVIVLSVSNETDGFDGDMIATITVAKARFGEACHLDARYEGKTGWWRELGRVSMRPKIETPPNLNALRDRVLEVLSSGPLRSKTAVWKLSGGNKQAIFSEVDSMVLDGSITLSGSGYSRREVVPIIQVDPQTRLPEAQS